MILYFSATGNCKYVATRIAQSTGQEILSIVDCINENQYTFKDDTISIISPTYSVWKEYEKAWTVYKSECKELEFAAAITNLAAIYKA